MSEIVKGLLEITTQLVKGISHTTDAVLDLDKRLRRIEQRQGLWRRFVDWIKGG